MKSLSSWTLERIKEDITLSWLEEKRYEWIPMLEASLHSLFEAKTTLIFGDQKRDWLIDYAIQKLNRSTFERPLLPILRLDAIFRYIDTIDSSQKEDLLDDMLSLLFPNGYNYFYIGSGRDKRSSLAKSKENSMMWLIDERKSGTLYLSSSDSELDRKLMQLILLYDKSIDAGLEGAFEFDGGV
jgi:hypothetical protein